MFINFQVQTKLVKNVKKILEFNVKSKVLGLKVDPDDCWCLSLKRLVIRNQRFRRMLMFTLSKKIGQIPQVLSNKKLCDDILKGTLFPKL